MPVIFFDRQPPPSTTARQASEPLAKLVWQYRVLPPAAVALSPRRGQGWPAAGAPFGGDVRGAAVVPEGVVGVGVLTRALVGAVVGSAERDVGGAIVTVVKTIAGRVVLGRTGVLPVVAGRVAAGRGAAGRGVVGRGAVDAAAGSTATGDVVSGALNPAGSDASCRESCTGPLSGGAPLTADTDPLEVCGPAVVEDCRALLPMMSTMPTNTPTVTLRAAAVSRTAAFPGTAPSPQHADGSIAAITVAHG